MMNSQSHVVDLHYAASIEALQKLPVTEVVQAANLIIDTLKAGNKVMFCGNGGSAADAQHIAAELMGRYKVDRQPLAAIALTTDTSALTAIANDDNFSEVFYRQVMGIGCAGDCLVAITTSGRSANVLNAISAARNKRITVIAMTGKLKSNLFRELNCWVQVPSTDTPIIQQCHITIGHVICELVEEAFSQ